jgi:YihY family inner membrane protein
MAPAGSGALLKSTIEYPRAAGLTVKRLFGFAIRVVKNFFRNKGLLLAGAVGYNALLSMLPLAAVLLVVVSHFLDVNLIIQIIQAELRIVLPGQSETLIEALRSFVVERDVIGGIGFAVLLFFSSIAFRMLEDAMSVIFRHHHREKQRHPVISALIPFVYIGVMAIALFFVTLVTAILESRAAGGFQILGMEIGFEQWSGWMFDFIGFVGLVIILSSFYRVMPVAKVRWRLALIGGGVAAILWEIVLRSVVWYFANISLVNVIYGSLATVVVVLLCMEIAAVIILLGAQVIAEIEKSAAAGVQWWERPPARKESKI